MNAVAWISTLWLAGAPIGGDAVEAVDVGTAEAREARSRAEERKAAKEREEAARKKAEPAPDNRRFFARESAYSVDAF